MNTVEKILADSESLAQSLRILTGATHSGKEAVYLSGTPESLRFLAKLLEAQADALDAGDDEAKCFSKFERDKNTLLFATDDSVDVFEIHCISQLPENHARKGRSPDV